MRLMIRTSVFLFIFVLVAACGGGDDNNNNSGDASDGLSVTAPPVQDTSIVEGCSEEVVDDWGDEVFVGLNYFADEGELYVRRAADDRRGELQSVWEEFLGRRASISTQPTPACLADVHEQSLAYIEAIMSDFQAFANAETTADEFRENVQPDIDALRAWVDSFAEIRQNLVVEN